MKEKSLFISFRDFIFRIISGLCVSKKVNIIFCFHSISNDGWLFSMTKENFELLIRRLLKLGEIVGLDELLRKVEEKKGRRFAITFDDGYESVYTKAYPVLKKYKLSACVFLVGLPDRKGSFGLIKGRKLLNLKQIRKLKNSGWEFGYHTRTHKDLRFMDSKKLNDEIEKGKKLLEKSLGFKIKYFAYPFGLFNKRVEKIVAKANYSYAFGADGGKVSKNSSNYKISRVLLDKYTKVGDLRVLSSNEGLFINKIVNYLMRFPLYFHEAI